MRDTSQRGICRSHANCARSVYREELSTGNTGRATHGCSRRVIAGRSRPGLREAGRTTAQTLMPLSNNARRGGNEKFPCMPRKRTCGGRFTNLTEASSSCSISHRAYCNLNQELSSWHEWSNVSNWEESFQDWINLHFLVSWVSASMRMSLNRPTTCGPRKAHSSLITMD